MKNRELIWKYLDQSITEDEFNELQVALKESQDLRKLYQHEVEVHQTFSELRKSDKSSNVISMNDQDFALKQPNKLYYLLPWAAALLITSMYFWNLQSSKLKVTLVEANSVDWRGQPVEIGEVFSNRIMHLMRGKIALQFPTKTKAIIEGPAYFQVLNNHSVELSSGLITVEHDGKPGEFFVETPLGKITDLGTKFGVSVGHGTTESLVMTEVIEGEIKVETKDVSQKKHFLEGESVLLTGYHDEVTYQNTFKNEQIKLNFSLEVGENKNEEELNFALGKPVTASGYWNNPRMGEVFPPTAVTDGRYADSGTAGDWSFWLAPQHKNGYFVIDLEKVELIKKIELQNTRNRHYGDRGTENFRIEISTDGENYIEIVNDKLNSIKSWNEASYPFKVIDLEPVPARYIKFIVESHYQSTTKNNSSLHGSGGLSEIRIY